MKRLLLHSSLFAAVALMADGVASAAPPEVADPNLYEQVSTSDAVLVLGGAKHKAEATYAKQHEDAAGKLKTTHLHIVFHLGSYVIARSVEDRSNDEADTHNIDPNVPAEMKDHLAYLNERKGDGSQIDANGIPTKTEATVLPVAAPVQEQPPAPAPEPLQVDAPPPTHEPPAGTPLTAEELAANKVDVGPDPTKTDGSSASGGQASVETGTGSAGTAPLGATEVSDIV